MILKVWDAKHLEHSNRKPYILPITCEIVLYSLYSSIAALFSNEEQSCMLFFMSKKRTLIIWLVLEAISITEISCAINS